ncbi:hypothetical protein LIER_30331 [Lithospermum erythrorhizon]|uniref:Glutamyl-tRNA reductase n=1 Tax=Lithospermum erythrorhizon TaxID=34254 RepID=A0AAV3RQJ4_LITER
MASSYSLSPSFYLNFPTNNNSLAYPFAYSSCWSSCSFNFQPCLSSRIKTTSFRISPRCELASNKSIKNGSLEASVSALQLLKTSGIDRYTKENSSLVVVGINVHTAPVEIREKLSIPEAEWPKSIGSLCALNHIEEAAVLSTCNRMEIYVVALSQKRGVKEVTEWMSKFSGVTVQELCQHLFLLYNEDATRHLFEVSAGLDSLVLGEGQILSQVKQVVKTGQGVEGFDKKISGMFKHAITVGKRVRSETSISTGSVSVSSASVDLALLKLPNKSLTGARVLVVGAGKMGKLVIKHLVAKGIRKMVVINRTEDRVAAIRNELKDVEIVYKPLSEMLSCITEADVIFTCTASESPLLLKEHIQKLPPANPQVGGRRLFIDISVPRNVESCITELDGVCVYNVDDLKEVVETNKEYRLRKAMEAQTIVLEEVKKFEAWKDSLEAVPTIKKLRAYAERIRASELEKCMSKMGDDLPQNKKKAIYDLSMGIVNKLLQGPMQHLRCDGDDRRTQTDMLENVNALNRVFGLDKDISLLEQKIRAKLGKNQSQAS